MSSLEKELATTEKGDVKPETSLQTDTAIESKDCGDTEKQILDDLTTKQLESNKTSEFDDDEDDFNSDELQLRWEDDDDESNIEKPNLKALENQTQDDLASKVPESVEIPSTSLVTAVKELENALIETNNKDVTCVTSKNFKDNDGTIENEQIIEEVGTNSSKEILENIDKIIGTDDVIEIKHDPGDPKKSCESSAETNKTDDPKVISDSEICKMDVDSSVSIKKDMADIQGITEEGEHTDSINLDDTTEAIDESNVLSSTVNDSFEDGDIKFEHGLKRPDMMLEIPTQEIIECLDDFDDSDCDKDENVDISKQMKNLEGDIDSNIIDDDIQIIDQEINENVSAEVSVKDKVKEVPGSEDLFENDVEISNDSEKNNIALKTIEMKNSELIVDGNSSEILSKPIKTTSINNKSQEDISMEVEDINIPEDESVQGSKEKSISQTVTPKISGIEVESKSDICQNNSQLSKLSQSPAEKIDEIVNTQHKFEITAEKSELISSKTKNGTATTPTTENVNTNNEKSIVELKPELITKTIADAEVEPTMSTLGQKADFERNNVKLPETLDMDVAPKNLESTHNVEATNKQILNEKLEAEKQNLSENKESEITAILDNKSDTELSTDLDKKSKTELSKHSESSVTKEPESMLVDTSDTEVPSSSEPTKSTEHANPAETNSKPTLNEKSDKKSDTQITTNFDKKSDTTLITNSESSANKKPEFMLANTLDTEIPSSSEPTKSTGPAKATETTGTLTLDEKSDKESDTEITAVSDKKSDNDMTTNSNKKVVPELLKGSESSANKETESMLVDSSDNEVLSSSEPIQSSEPAKPTETIVTTKLDVKSNTETPKDAKKTSENEEPMSIAESSNSEATMTISDQKVGTEGPSQESGNIDPTSVQSTKESGNIEPTSVVSPIESGNIDSTSVISPIESGNIDSTSVISPIESGNIDPTSVQSPKESGNIDSTSVISPIESGNIDSTSVISPIESGNIEPTSVQSPKESGNIDSTSVISPIESGNIEPTSVISPKESGNIETSSVSTKESTSGTDPTSVQSTKESGLIDPTFDQPSTSKETNNSLDQVPDTTDEVPVVEDSLGLLAESSRVVEDDEEAEEDEEVDADDDEEFDPDDESSNQMTAENSEDSSAQPDRENGQTDKEDITPTAEEKEFSFDIAGVGEAADVEMDITEEETKVDIATSEVAAAPTEAAVEIDTDKEPETPGQPVDIETVKLSDSSDNETEVAANCILKELLSKEASLPAEMIKKLSEAVVELEGSSSEDDVQEVNKTAVDQVAPSVDQNEDKKVNQEDVKIEAASSEKKEIIPKTDDKEISEKKEPDCGTEVFNLDSDDEVPIGSEVTVVEKPESNKCINPWCRSGARATYVVADAAARAYFDANKKKKYRVCVACAENVAQRTKGLVNGMKELTPLLQMDLRKVSSETVEISDSDSDDGEGDSKPEVLGENGAKFLEEHLADVINETWLKYKLDERLTAAQSELNDELNKLEAESKEIDTMLNECQIATDLLRNQLYATFEPERRELTAICIVDTPLEKYSLCENTFLAATQDKNLKRRTSAVSEQPAKRPAIPLGYAPLDADDSKSANIEASNDDDKDVSVVKLSIEAAPSDLPPPGEISRPPVRTGMSVFAMRNSFCTWVPGKIIDVLPKNPANAFTMCRVKFEIRTKIATRVLAARCLAYIEPADVRLTIGTRVIALSKENVKSDEPNQNKKSFYSGIVAEIPNPVNNYRYLIFFDHGYAQYVHHRDTRVVCESSNLVWEEVHPNSREFVKQYLVAYPERPMVRLHAGQKLKTEWNGKWWVTKVLQVDASLVEVSFEDDRTEWIYRGSTRLAPLFLELQAAERQRARPLPRSNQRRMNMPYVEYTRSEEQNKAEAIAAEQARQQQQQNEELRRQRAVAKKSTALPLPAPNHATHPNLDSVTSRVVYYTPKNVVKPHKMVPHTCSPKCKRTDVLALKDLRTYNPLAKPLLSGWERQIVRYKGHKEVMYRAPCGRRVRDMRELHEYLRRVHADMAVDLFDFGPNTHCLAEFVLNKCLVGKKDLSHGKENVPVPCVNYYDESLPEFCSYNTERTPTAGVPLNLDPEFLCGCDCTDDCQDKSKCACWKMTLEGARTIGLDDNVGYVYKRLPEPLPSGIYECNSRCKCKHTCLNRVAQHPLQLKLQVFKTMNRGWGIRALNDVPKGSFLCVYAGNLLTDATANLDGLNEGDEYLAELDYIEVVEQMKEGYEEDIPDEDKKLDRKASKSSSEESSSEEEEDVAKDDKEDDDFQPGFIGLGVTEFSKRLRKRDRTKKKEEEKEKEKGKEIDKGMEDDGCITISDDEEAKEPTRFMAQAGIGANEFVSKYRSVRTLYGKDEACYIMDAKVQGNIGRYLNHSCTPNVFVQNVFVDTHDPRFPWVAFFALSHIRAGTELTWNYNYDVGSVPGKVLYCYCGAPNCRGRLL